eukprot:CAMPEP_0119335286 /NCGR_PEP_ID=MMETSP1333-20130426/89222_1 /TAXON_ID=418940 /ORGANISM="Scyphosphaera apsteinii, Strain RCC1455" /LENGTH=334 /DNA_ID=CAMNT_0007345795 /DNA_START=258 /DNA_END=1262 /DNA_ORIENTATION=-
MAQTTALAVPRLTFQKVGVSVVQLVHIAKCAGTHLTRQLNTVVANSAARLVSWESCMVFFEPSTLMLTMLRSPRSHVLSQFDHLRGLAQSPSWFFSRMLSPSFPLSTNRKADFSTWLQHFHRSQRIADADCSRVWDRHWLNFSRQPCWYEPPFDCVAPLDFNGYNPHNMQARHLLCTHRPAFAGHHVFADTGLEPDAAAAVSAMRRLDWVGLVELFSESLCVFRARWTGVVPADCQCSQQGQGPLAKSAKGNPHHGSGDRHGPGDELLSDPMHVAMIDAMTTVDVILYRAAATRLLESIRRLEKASGVTIACPSRLSAFREATAYIFNDSTALK